MNVPSKLVLILYVKIIHVPCYHQNGRETLAHRETVNLTRKGFKMFLQYSLSVLTDERERVSVSMNNKHISLARRVEDGERENKDKLTQLGFLSSSGQATEFAQMFSLPR